jgi:two-component system sensor histidine kinase TtrS
LLHVAHIEWLVRRRTRELEAEAARNRRLERELAHTERVSSMATLAGSLAHDLNQPLAAISTFAGGLLRRQREGTLEPEAGTRALERIVEQANRASAFIAAMRRFLAKEPEHPERLDLRDVVDEAVMLLAPQARRAGLTLAWDRPRRPAPSTGVEVQLRQVVVALVQNALDATRAAGRDAPVAIDLARDGGRWRLEVADRGAGLADEAKARAFEPFFSTKEGLGLGLATAAAIVDHHDGALELRDRDGGGTTARLTLPASIEEETTPG